MKTGRSRNEQQASAKQAYWLHYGEATYGPYKSEAEAFRIAQIRGYIDFTIYDNFDDAQAEHEIECDR